MKLSELKTRLKNKYVVRIVAGPLHFLEVA